MQRVEDVPLLTGTATFVDDIDLLDQVHASIVGSPAAHARLINIETSEVKTFPGVMTVVTAADIPDVRIPIRLE